MLWLFLLFQRRNRLLLSTDGILLYVARRLRYVSSSVCVNRWYCRYIAVLCVKDCVKYKCRTCFSPVQCRNALRRQGFGGHPSHASSTTSLIFASKKNLRIAGWPAIRSFSKGWWAMTDSNRRHFACKANALTN